MNKTKQNLIIASAIVNLLGCVANLIVAILMATQSEKVLQFLQEYYIYSPSYNLVFNIITFTAGLVGSILLFYCVRQKGRYFRTSYGSYIAGFVIVVICGGFLAWILLFISMFIADIVIINHPNDIKREEKLEEKAYEDKKRKIEELKKMRDDGIISEEEYKQKLFDLL